MTLKPVARSPLKQVARSPLLRVSSAAAAASVTTFGTLSDSRDDWDTGPTGPDWYDGTQRNIRPFSQDNVPASIYLPWVRPDMEMVANCGASGTQLNIWNSGARPNGRTITALHTLAPQVVFVQFPTNDIQLNVIDAATRDSIAARCLVDFTAMLANLVAAGRKVVCGTGMQRSDSIGANCYSTNTAFKRDCLDTVNTNLITHINGTYSASQVQIADLRALTNLGGVTTGAYLNTAIAPDGCHLNQLGARAVAAVYATALAALGFPALGVQPVYRATSANLIASLSTSNVGDSGNGGCILNNCTISAPSFATVGGDPAVTYTVTPSAAGFFASQIVANVGTIANTPPNTFATGNKLRGGIIMTVDNGAGALAAAPDNIDLLMYATFTVATEQIVSNGSLGNAVGSLAGGPLLSANVGLCPRTMPAGSSEIGAPAFGAGLRLWPFIYFQNGAPFRVIYRRPSIHVVS